LPGAASFLEDQGPARGPAGSDAFWTGFDAIVHDLAPKKPPPLLANATPADQIDAWHKAHPGRSPTCRRIAASSERIGYLVVPPPT